MKTKFILTDWNNKSRRITKKEAMTLITPEQLQHVKEAFLRDSYECNEYMVQGGRLSIWFEK